MSLSRREVILAAATSAVVVGLVSWVIASPLIKTVQTAHAQLAKLQNEKSVLQKLISQRSLMLGQLEGLRAQLPRFKPDEQVSAQIISAVKKIADDESLTLSRLDPDPEKPIGDLSEVAIQCQWEGALDSITKFLYAVQSQGAMLDIRQLNIQPAQNTTQAGRLRGNFKMYYAFMRVKPGTPPPAPAPAAMATNAASNAVESVAPVMTIATNTAPAPAPAAASNPAPAAPQAPVAPQPISSAAPHTTAPAPSLPRLPGLPGLPKLPGK
jgi:Tfp pilus assembly protein PilO